MFLITYKGLMFVNSYQYRIDFLQLVILQCHKWLPITFMKYTTASEKNKTWKKNYENCEKNENHKKPIKKYFSKKVGSIHRSSGNMPIHIMPGILYIRLRHYIIMPLLHPLANFFHLQYTIHNFIFSFFILTIYKQ